MGLNGDVLGTAKLGHAAGGAVRLSGRERKFGVLLYSLLVNR